MNVRSATTKFSLQDWSLPREFVTDHLDVDLLAHTEPDAADEVLIDPWLKLSHPI